MKRIIPFIHEVIIDHTNASSIAIDATAGNGHDTLFLAKHTKHVYVFDVQETALKNTIKRLKQHQLDNVTTIHSSHALLSQYVKEPFDVVVFNLGYLPQSDQTIITQESSTLDAINQALKGLNPEGIVCLTLYTGHAGGQEEADAVEAYVQTLPSKKYDVLKYQFVNKEKAPYNIIIKKH